MVGLAAGDEGRLELALASLCTAQVFDVSRRAREQDSVLAILGELLDAGRVDVASALLKDKSLPKNALYYVGFHFAEGIGPVREAGAKMLKSLVERSPGSEEGRQAKQKLFLEGVLELKTARQRKGILEARAEVLLAPADEAGRERGLAEKREAKAKAKAEKKTAGKAKAGGPKAVSNPGPRKPPSPSKKAD